MNGSEPDFVRAFFDRLLDADTVSIIVPNIKLCDVGDAPARPPCGPAPCRGILTAQPPGLFSLLTSDQVTAPCRAPLPLEHAIDEVDWQRRPDHPRPNGSTAATGLYECTVTTINRDEMAGDWQHAGSSR